MMMTMPHWTIAAWCSGRRLSLDEGAPRNAVQLGSIAGAVYAYVLGELSRWIGLGVEAECDALREHLVRAEFRMASDAL